MGLQRRAQLQLRRLGRNGTEHHGAEKPGLAPPGPAALNGRETEQARWVILTALRTNATIGFGPLRIHKAE
jgi:hypothetical protein